jgi:hypothetical protein
MASLATRAWWSEHLSREEWNIGIVDQPAIDIIRRGFQRAPRWLQKSPDVMLADPSCTVIRDGQLLILAERMDYRSGRGEIWGAVLQSADEFENLRLQPWLTAATHLSYPFPFVGDDGRICLTVESAEAGSLFLWREQDNSWESSARIILEQPVVDATIWRGPDRWWLFCGLSNDNPNERLHLFHAQTLQGPWTAHRSNPVKIDLSSSRPAGPLFIVNGMLIRPAQDCSRTYGGAVVLNEICQLDLDGFHERGIRKLEPFTTEYPDGLHTFCPAGDFTLIDGKRWIYRKRELANRALRKYRSILRSRKSTTGAPYLTRNPGSWPYQELTTEIVTGYLDVANRDFEGTEVERTAYARQPRRIADRGARRR